MRKVTKAPLGAILRLGVIGFIVGRVAGQLTKQEGGWDEKSDDHGGGALFLVFECLCQQ